MSLTGRYDLDHLPMPQYDSESATAELLITSDGAIYTICQFYTEDEGNTEQISVELIQLVGTWPQAITDPSITFKRDDYDTYLEMHTAAEAQYAEFVSFLLSVPAPV